MLNTHTLVKNLVSAGITEQAAAVISDAILSGTQDHAQRLEREQIEIITDLEVIKKTGATKADVIKLESEVATKKDVTEVRNEIAKVSNEVYRSKVDILKWMFTLFATNVGLMITIALTMIGLYLKYH